MRPPSFPQAVLGVDMDADELKLIFDHVCRSGSSVRPKRLAPARIPPASRPLSTHASCGGEAALPPSPRPPPPPQPAGRMPEEPTVCLQSTMTLDAVVKWWQDDAASSDNEECDFRRAVRLRGVFASAKASLLVLAEPTESHLAAKSLFQRINVVCGQHEHRITMDNLRVLTDGPSPHPPADFS